MATYHCKGGTVTLNGKEVPLGSLAITNDSPAAERKPFATPNFEGFSVTMSFTIDPKAYDIMYRIFVGTNINYNLRQLHQNLGRYMRWPYTN